MKKKTLFSKTTKGLLVAFFLCLLLPTNNVFAQGANAPEAASFEPVDATDMVNLVTGDLSYVLPLLNIPSPEGGYPISLSYHAGIAMDQEASWVGLGWSLNPGAINRAVNGYPDDWGEANVSEFFYDKGWTNSYYNFGAGISFKNSISVGLGLSWGSNQSLGGFVSASIGFKGSNGNVGSIGGHIGTNGIGINGGVNSFSASVSTSGVGIGYSGTSKTSPNFGVNLNHSYSSGISGGISVAKQGKSKGKSSGVGISFSSNGVSANAKVNGYGAGISTAAQSINSGDYNISMSTSGFFIPAYIFYVNFSHTKVKYSLFKYNNLYTSGVLYPVKANKLQYYDAPNQNSRSRRLEENHFMDVNIIQPFKQNSSYDDLIVDSKKNDRNNLIVPSYDNYSVNAQGLSGTISPYIHNELNLSGRGRGQQNPDNEYVNYLNHDIEEYLAAPSSGGTNGADYNAIKKKYFTFSSAYNSFLRLKKSNIAKTGVHSTSTDQLMNTYKTNSIFTNNYNSLSSTGRKKEGNNIITYTNKEIRQGNILNFIDTKELNNQNIEVNLDRSDTKVFLDDGIGAFKITTLDGKTYHYSLPVYQFESFYKNFQKINGNGDAIATEDENFFEIQKNTPYATHWLLTAITGPDYVDTNTNGKVDKNDYGYWVEFDYGKWSDSYIWQTPIEEIIDKDDATKKTYSYSWGRKQVYYLDAIKTRTHTALFVKDLREDNKSKSKFITGNIPWSAGESFLFKHYKEFKNPTEKKNLKAGDIIYNEAQNQYILSKLNPTYHYYSKKSTLKYIAITSNRSLKLKKILLLKNDHVNYDKTRGDIINSEIGYFSKNIGHSLSFGHTSGLYPLGEFTSSPIILKQLKIHQHQNVLDVKDIEGLNLESQVSEVINFSHDYSLAKNAPNTTSGRLTLKKVNFKGKGGTQLIPPYQFNYKNEYTQYNKDDIDAWGYHKTYPSTWSLNQIITPTGGKINMQYEADTYDSEAAYEIEQEFSNISSVSTIGGNLKIIFGSGSSSTLTNFKVNRYYRITHRLITTREDNYGQGFDTFSEDFDLRYKVVNVGSNWIEIDPESTNANLHLYTNGVCANPSSQEGECIENLIVYGSSSNISQGTNGGGIRTKSITINDGLKNNATTEYVYKYGVTSYAPTKEQKGIPYVSELPAPMVMYGSVEMQTKDGVNNYIGKTVYNFETLESRKEEAGYIFSLGEAFRVKENQNTTFEGDKVIVNKYTIESRLGNLGRIKSITSYNTLNQPLQISKNTYKKDLETDGEIGVTQESHKSYKRVVKNSIEQFYVSSTSKISYPSVLKSNSVTQGGIGITKHFDKHDFLTGQVLETRTYASDGTAFKTKVVPAYTKYSAMGSKVDSNTNKNMLTQQAASYTYLLENGIEKIVGAGITTWNNNWSYRDYKGLQSNSVNETPVWRKHKTFVWKGDLNNDGTYATFTGEEDNFNWGLGQSQTDEDWKKVSEVTRYDHYSAPLESKDINNNFASSKMGDNNTKVIATANAAYTDMYYSGAEYVVADHLDYFDGEIKSTGHKNVAENLAHTGTSVVEINAGQNAFEVSIPSNTNRTTIIKQRFKVAVWVKKKSNGTVPPLKIKVGGASVDFVSEEDVPAGNWVQKQGYITIPTTATIVAITSTETVVLDDFRLHPAVSSMTSYVYNEFDEVTFITSSNGLSTHYIYDDAGRLKQTLVEVIDFNGPGSGGFKSVQKNSYNYKK